MKKIILFLLGAFALGAKDINVGFFDKVHIETSGEAYITQGDKNALRIEGDAEILKHIVAKVSDNTLKLSIKRSVFISNKSRNSVKFYIELKDLTSLEIDGSADTYMKTLTGDKLEVEIDGSGNVTLDKAVLNTFELDSDGSGDVALSGDVKNIDIDMEGSGNLDMDSLTNNTFAFEIGGSGDISIANIANKTLTGKIEGSGRVDIKGTGETLKLDINGSGDFDGKNYLVKDVDIEIDGSGVAIINAGGNIDADLSGSGDLYYYGGGYLRNLKKNGSGEIIKKY